MAVGCGCIVYAEGKDIADALGEFYEEELRDSLEESDFDVYGEKDDDETIDVDFTVMSQDPPRIWRNNATGTTRYPTCWF